jgi:hypothetical protein
MASPGLSEFVTASLQNRSKKFADNVTKNVALLNRLEGKDGGSHIQVVDGGRTLVEPLEYQENGSFVWYSGYEKVNIQPSEIMSAAEFDWKQASAAVTISGLEQIQNAGKNRFLPLLDKRTKNAEKTMRNNVGIGLYSDGTGFGGKQIGGLDLLVSTSPATGTVGGINRANWLFWRNEAINSATDPKGAITKVNVVDYFNQMAIALTRGTDRPDIILCGTTVYTAYLGALQGIQRITDDGGSKMQGAGFTALKYFGVGQSTDVVLDGGHGGGCPAGRAYFLNTDYIYFKVFEGRYFEPIEGDRMATNQDAIVKLLAFAGNMTISNPSLQGVLY